MRTYRLIYTTVHGYPQTFGMAHTCKLQALNMKLQQEEYFRSRRDITWELRCYEDL
jgi:hypothetical protein